MNTVKKDFAAYENIINIDAMIMTIVIILRFLPGKINLYNGTTRIAAARMQYMTRKINPNIDNYEPHIFLFSTVTVTVMPDFYACGK